MSALVEAVRLGRLAGLEALRDALADEIAAGSGQVAALAKQLREVLAEVEALSKDQKGSRVDDLARRRTARRSDAAGSGVAAGGGG